MPDVPLAMPMLAVEIGDLDQILLGALVLLIALTLIAIISSFIGGAKRRKRRQIEADATWANAWGSSLTETRWVCDDLIPAKYAAFAHGDIERMRELEAKYTTLEAVTPNSYIDRQLSKLRKTLGDLVVSARGVVDSPMEDPGDHLIAYTQRHATFVKQVDNLVNRA
ncbi:MAG: hypothetical protein ABFR95_04745 [Actinomycetota bacterium]